MSAGIEIDGKKMLPIKEVVTDFSYSKDYITRLARDKKIEALFVGRQWFIDVDSLERYSQLSAVEQELRKHRLSVERKQEKKIHTALQTQVERQERKVQSLHVRSVVAASMVLGFGLLGGGLSYGFISDTYLFQSVVTQKQIAVPAKAADTFALQTGTIETKTTPTAVVTNTELVGTGSETVRDIRSLGSIEEGILLLPRKSTSSGFVTSAFSDEVEIRKAANGDEMIVRVDVEGNTIGEEILFVRVPVVNNEIPI